MSVDPFVSTCRCDADYTSEQLRRLPFRGVIERLDAGLAELRACRCGRLLRLKVRAVTCIALVPELAMTNADTSGA